MKTIEQQIKELAIYDLIRWLGNTKCYLYSSYGNMTKKEKRFTLHKIRLLEGRINNENNN